MVGFGCWEVEEDLEQTLKMGGLVEIRPANDVGDALCGVVDDYGQMVTRRRILADNDRVTPAGGVGWYNLRLGRRRRRSTLGR